MCCNPALRAERERHRAERRAIRHEFRERRRELREERRARKHGYVGPVAQYPAITSRMTIAAPNSTRFINKGEDSLPDMRQLVIAPSPRARAATKSEVGSTMTVTSTYADAAPPSYKAVMAQDKVPRASEGPGMVRNASASMSLSQKQLSEAQRQCEQHGHQPSRRKFGAMGVVGGIAFFPWGLFW